MSNSYKFKFLIGTILFFVINLSIKRVIGEHASSMLIEQAIITTIFSFLIAIAATLVTLIFNRKNWIKKLWHYYLTSFVLLALISIFGNMARTHVETTTYSANKIESANSVLTNEQNSKLVKKTKNYKDNIYRDTLKNGYIIINKGGRECGRSCGWRRTGGLWGLQDSNKNIVHSTVFQELAQGNDELHFKYQDKWGVMDFEGNLIHAAKYDYPLRLDQKYNWVSIGGEYGLIDDMGRIKIPHIFEYSKGIDGLELKYEHLDENGPYSAFRGLIFASDIFLESKLLSLPVLLTDNMGLYDINSGKIKELSIKYLYLGGDDLPSPYYYYSNDYRKLKYLEDVGCNDFQKLGLYNLNEDRIIIEEGKFDGIYYRSRNSTNVILVCIDCKAMSCGNAGGDRCYCGFQDGFWGAFNTTGELLESCSMPKNKIVKLLDL